MEDTPSQEKVIMSMDLGALGTKMLYMIMQFDRFLTNNDIAEFETITQQELEELIGGYIDSDGTDEHTERVIELLVENKSIIDNGNGTYSKVPIAES